MWSLFTVLLLTMGPSDPASHVRAESPVMRALLDEAMLKSPTVQALVSELECSDTIVYVEFTRVPGIRRARTKLVAAPEGFRFLRISIHVLVPPVDRLPLLAHELQHAAEIARETSVRDDKAMRRLYQRIGSEAWDDTFETIEAMEVERRARAEQFARRSSPRQQ